MIFLLLILAALASLAGTEIVRRQAIRRAVFDHPNARSSHSVPTPRGGGVAIAAVFLSAIAGGSLAGWIPRELGIALIGGGLLVAVIGGIDDVRSLPARIRFGAHVAAGAWAVWWLGGLPKASIGTAALDLGVVGWAVAVFVIVAAINFYNFMDGIDGIAGVEAVMVGLGGAGLLAYAGHPGLALAAALLGACAAGFLVLNWSPAKIFMGDAGSGMIGFALATIAIASERATAVPLLVWGILLGVFVVDATVTFLRRAARRHRLHEAHREHAYQRIVRSGWSHARTSASVAVINALLVGLGFAAMADARRAVFAALIGGALLTTIYLVVERKWPMFSASGRS